MDSYIFFSFINNYNNKFEDFNNNINKIQDFYINNTDTYTDINRSFNVISSLYSNECVNSSLCSGTNAEINSNIKNNFIKKYNVYIKKNNYSNNVFLLENSSLSEHKCSNKLIVKECPVCYNNIYPLNHTILDCKHFLCKYCYEKWNEKCCENNCKISCPLCRK
jgi:hypothetical protein